MKIKHLLLFGFLFGLLTVSCSESKEESRYANWKERNEHFIDSIATVYDSGLDKELYRVEDSRNVGTYIYYKIRTESAETEKPKLTSSVNVYYRGMFINENTLGKLESPYLITSLYKLDASDVFDSNFKGDDPDVKKETPTQFTLNGNIISGFSEILQHMSPGSRWEVYFSAKSGYGNTNMGKVPAHSVLIFDLTLRDIIDKK